MTRRHDDYEEAVERSFWSSDIRFIAEQIDALEKVNAWDGVVVLAKDNKILGTAWYNIEVEEWCFDPIRHGEQT